MSASVFKFTDKEIADLKALPRTIRLEGDEEQGWDFSKSSFAKYPQEDTEIFKKCLEKDWESIKEKVSYLVKDPEQEQKIFELIRDNY